VQSREIAALALACALLAACSGEDVPAPRAAPTPSTTSAAVVTGSHVPARAVLALVPADATVLTVTDFARVRDQLGDDGQDEAALWRRADARAPLLTRGLFRGAGGVTQADVLWEAHFSGGVDGFVVRFADGVDLTGVRPPAGAQVRPAEHLMVSGVASDPATSWTSVPGLARLVRDDAESTYLQRGCLPGRADEDLDPLDAFGVELGSTIATVRLGAGRSDLFDRMRRGADDPAFGEGFADGAADPSSGRIGYRVVDAVPAAHLTLARRLPFAVCAS
jgi:hypothetical protein